MFKDIFQKTVIPLLTILNKTSINRLLLYFTFAFPIYVTFMYKDELKLLLFETKQNVEIASISDVQAKCFELKNEYGAESVEVYIYQPKGSDKTHKERAVFSSGDSYKPLNSYQNINLYSRTNILAEINKNGYVKIDVNSGYDESVVLKSFDLDSYFIVPIVGTNKEVIGEVIWIYKNKFNSNISDLIIESQIFKQYIKN